jgi:formylglycine-generating enzyme required for sulfatase activity
MPSNLEVLSKITEAVLCPPFEWCRVVGGTVTLEDAQQCGGTKGGDYQIADFAIAKYPITNAQYEKFVADTNGYPNVQWWAYSPQATQWHRDHPHPKSTAFVGADLPRTRVSWFDSLAFCNWLSSRLKYSSAEGTVRLPTEPEWQHAAVGSTRWPYPWGHQLTEAGGNYALRVGQPTSVGAYPEGQSRDGVLDMIGNVWEWCLTAWGKADADVTGYDQRVIKGEAWNVSIPEHLSASDRGAHSPRGQLNDCGFRCACVNSDQETQ